MPVFAYRALRPSGGAESGVVDATSTRGAWQALRARGVFPTELRAEAARASAPARRVAAAELAAATRQLATLVAASLPVAEALEVVAEQAADPVRASRSPGRSARARASSPRSTAISYTRARRAAHCRRSSNGWRSTPRRRRRCALACGPR